MWKAVAICAVCWNEQNPDRPTPVTINTDAIETCIDCGEFTQSGIYVRRDVAE